MGVAMNSVTEARIFEMLGRLFVEATLNRERADSMTEQLQQAQMETQGWRLKAGDPSKDVAK